MKYKIVFLNDTATTEIYTLSLHDALPICGEDLVAAYLEGLRDGLLHAARDLDGVVIAGQLFQEDDELVAAEPRHRVAGPERSEEHTSELQSRQYLVCRLLLEKKTLAVLRS